MPTINGQQRNIVSTLSMNTPITSELAVIGEQDLYAVSLVAGRTYTFAMNGNASASPSGVEIRDTYIELYDANGNALRSDDDSGEGRNSWLSYTAGTTGTYYLNARAFSDVYSGGYDLTVTGQNSAPEQSGVLTALSSVTAGSTITLLRSQLLQGYSDPDGNSLSITTIGLSNGGNLTALSDGSGWTYTPTSAGQVNVNYTVSDGSLSLEASNTFTVNQPAALNAINLVQVGDSSHTSEDGGAVTYNIGLSNALTAGSLTITLRSNDVSEGRFLVDGQLQDTLTLTFSAGGSTSQSFVVKGIQDYDNDGAAPYTINARVADGIVARAASSQGNWTEAIRNFNGGTATTDNRSVTLYNDGDLDSQGRDRDVALYLIGDESRPRQDMLVGNDGADRLYGGYMIDDLYGGIGGDRLYGGYEDDQLYGGDGNDQLYGEQDDDYLRGDAGNDRMDGGIGADTMVGGEGNDVYYVTLGDDGAVEDLIDESTVTGGTGTDTIYIPFQVESYVAPVGVEIVRMNAGFGDSAVTGNTSNNGLYGNAGNNALDGGSGNDTLDGGSGADSMLGGVGNDSMAGGVGNDALVGGTGNDVIAGGTGVDSLAGGAGSDVFDFNSLNEMGSSSSTADIVADMAAGDVVDLSTIDANSAVAGNQAFVWVSGGTFTAGVSTTAPAHSGFSAAGGQIYFQGDYLYVDTDTDVQAEYVIRVVGVDLNASLVTE